MLFSYIMILQPCSSLDRPVAVFGLVFLESNRLDFNLFFVFVSDFTSQNLS